MAVKVRAGSKVARLLDSLKPKKAKEAKPNEPTTYRASGRQRAKGKRKAFDVLAARRHDYDLLVSRIKEHAAGYRQPGSLKKH